MPLYPAFKQASALLTLVLLIAIAGLANIKTNASYLVYFDKSDQLVKNYISKQSSFNKHSSLILVLHNEHSTLAKSPNFYKNSKKLLQYLQQLAQVQKTDSFLTELRWRNNLLATSNKNTARLLSTDASTALISLDVKLDDPTSAQQIVKFNQQVLQAARSQYPDNNIKLYLSGELGLNNAYIESVRHDLSLFIPFLLLTMFGVLVWLFRSVKVALAMLSVGIIATMASFGIISWLGYPLASINAFTPIMIIGLSLVTNMHGTIAFYQRLAAGKSRKAALRSSFKDNLIPLSMSCITTALGFLFLLNSPSPPIVVTGISSALGIFFSLTLSLSVFQAMLYRYAPKAISQKSLVLINWAYPSIAFFKQYSAKVIIASSALALMGLIGLSQLTINDNVYQYFPKDYGFRQSVALLNEKFNGVVSIDYIIERQELPEATTSVSPWLAEDLSQIYQLLEYANTLSDVNSTFPSANILNVNNLNNYYLQQNTSKSSLYTYLDKRDHRIRIQLRFKEMSSRQLLDIDNNITSWVAANNLDRLKVANGTSPDLLFANVGYNNASSMFSSLLLALSIISIVSGLLLRSWWLCVLVFICNFLPIIIAYGALGLTGGYLSLGSTVVIGMIIGIIVDDTLHLLFKFNNYQKKFTLMKALCKLQQKVFPAVIISSFIIILALSIGLTSDFKPTFEISFFSIIVILLALLTDVLLLPVLLKLRNNTELSNEAKSS
ncbi:MAG: MMPL family transporter [Oceanospirillaceae bacterium]